MKTRYFSRRFPLNLQIFVSCKPLVCEKRLNIFSFYIFRGDPIHQSAIAKGGDPFHLKCKGGGTPFTKVGTSLITAKWLQDFSIVLSLPYLSNYMFPTSKDTKIENNAQIKRIVVVR